MPIWYRKQILSNLKSSPVYFAELDTANLFNGRLSPASLDNVAFGESLGSVSPNLQFGSGFKLIGYFYLFWRFYNSLTEIYAN